MRLLFTLTIFLVFFSPQLLAVETEKCGERRAMEGTVFTLTIHRSFHGDSTFQLCEREKPENSFLILKYNKNITIKKISSLEFKEFYSQYRFVASVPTVQRPSGRLRPSRPCQLFVLEDESSAVGIRSLSRHAVIARWSLRPTHVWRS